MGVYRIKGSPFYYWRCSLHGQRYSGPTKQTSRRKAEAFFHSERQRLIKEIQDGPSKKPNRMTLNEAAALYYDQHASNLKNASDYDYQLEQLVDGMGADTFMDEMTTGHLAALQAEIRGKKTRYGTLPSNRTVNAVVPEMARKLWKYCHDVLEIELGKEPKWGSLKLHQTEERIRELSAEEEQKLFKNLRQDYHPLMRFALLSSLRLSNLMKLTWKNIDLAAGIIAVKGKSRKEAGKQIIIPITDPMRAILGTCRGQHPIYVFTYICKRPSGRRKKGERYPFTKSTFRRPFKKALEDAGIEDFRFHDFRHTGATRTLRASKNLKAVQMMLGHEDITTTAKYAHVMLDDIKAAMDAAHCQNIAKIDKTAKTK